MICGPVGSQFLTFFVAQQAPKVIFCPTLHDVESFRPICSMKLDKLAPNWAKLRQIQQGVGGGKKDPTPRSYDLSSHHLETNWWWNPLRKSGWHFFSIGTAYEEM